MKISRLRNNILACLFILENIYTIKKIVDRSYIIHYTYRESYLDTSYDEIIKDIDDMIKDIKNNKYKTDEQMYSLHDSFSKIIKLLYKSNNLEVKEDDIKKLEEIYKYIMSSENFISQIKESWLDFLSLGLKSIKEKVK